jgi:hypothetical protein
LKANAGSSVDTTNRKPAAKNLRFIDELYFDVRRTSTPLVPLDVAVRVGAAPMTSGA